MTEFAPISLFSSGFELLPKTTDSWMVCLSFSPSSLNKVAILEKAR